MRVLRSPGTLEAGSERLRSSPEGMRAMADRDGPVQLRGGGAMNGSTANGRAANGRVPKRDSDEIVAEIERTRQNLAHTIDTLADRVSPASNVRRLRERAAEQVTRPEVQLAALAIMLAATGVA